MPMDEVPWQKITSPILETGLAALNMLYHQSQQAGFLFGYHWPLRQGGHRVVTFYAKPVAKPIHSP